MKTSKLVYCLAWLIYAHTAGQHEQPAPCDGGTEGSGCAHAEEQHERADRTVILGDNGVRNLRIETVEAVKRDLETTIFSIGRIEEIPAKRAVLSSRIAGRIVELNAFVGDSVNKYQKLAKVESRQLGDPPPTIELLAPRRGVVVDSHIRLGEPVEPSVELMDIVDYSKLWAVAKIPEKEAARISIGSRAYIRIPAMGDERIEATLSRFGVEADRYAGAVDGIFVIDNPNEKLRPGMRAEFSIILSSREDVLAIPRIAVQGNPDNRIVFVKDSELPNAYVRSPVVLGEQNDRYLEVISGLCPGDQVVTQGAYALSFVGEGSGMSLKEALDAAHGHEHNEDGSEITPEQHAGREKHKNEHHDEHEDCYEHEHDDEHKWSSKFSLPLTIYALVVTPFLLIIRRQFRCS